MPKILAPAESIHIYARIYARIYASTSLTKDKNLVRCLKTTKGENKVSIPIRRIYFSGRPVATALATAAIWRGYALA